MKCAAQENTSAGWLGLRAVSFLPALEAGELPAPHAHGATALGDPREKPGLEAIT